MARNQPKLKIVKTIKHENFIIKQYIGFIRLWVPKGRKPKFIKVYAGDWFRLYKYGGKTKQTKKLRFRDRKTMRKVNDMIQDWVDKVIKVK